eukprot:2799451-Rhodomonas_salina.1
MAAQRVGLGGLLRVVPVRAVRHLPDAPPRQAVRRGSRSRVQGPGLGVICHMRRHDKQFAEVSSCSGSRVKGLGRGLMGSSALRPRGEGLGVICQMRRHDKQFAEVSSCSGFRVQGSGLRGSGFRVQGSGFRVQGSFALRPRVEGVAGVICEMHRANQAVLRGSFHCG